MEGGGQILRISLALSTLLRKPIQFVKIRAGRRKPGLRNQHLIGMQFVGSLCDASITGGKVQSMTVSYTPDDLDVSEESYEIDCVTGGATGLVIQVSLPCLLFGAKRATPDTPVSVRILGGTNGDFAPNFDYLQHVFTPVFCRGFGLDAAFSIECLRRCFGFTGKDGTNGEVILKMLNHIDESKGLQPLTLVDRGTVAKLHILSIATGNAREITAQRLGEAVQGRLEKFFGSEPEYFLEVKHVDAKQAIGSNVQAMVFLTSSTGCVFGSVEKKGRKDQQDKVARKIADRLIGDWTDMGCVDQYLQDQFIIFMSLANGKSRLRIGKKMTLHTRTAIHFCQEICGVAFDTDVQDDGSQILSVEGIAHGVTKEAEEEEGETSG